MLLSRLLHCVCGMLTKCVPAIYLLPDLVFISSVLSVVPLRSSQLSTTREVLLWLIYRTAGDPGVP